MMTSSKNQNVMYIFLILVRSTTKLPSLGEFGEILQEIIGSDVTKGGVWGGVAPPHFWKCLSELSEFWRKFDLIVGILTKNVFVVGIIGKIHTSL